MRYASVFLGLGSNIGDRLNFLTTAVKEIASLDEVRLVQYSSVYESAPVGYLNQPDFLNIVVELTTNVQPVILLRETQRIEEALGRVRELRWGPRTIDIDILYWGNEKMSESHLNIPHPEAAKRRFVLLALNEIATDFEAPPHFHKISHLLAKISDPGRVELFLPKEEYVIN